MTSSDAVLRQWGRKMATIGYSRVSTTGQDQRMQIDALKLAGCDYVVTEVGSGAVEKARPQLRNLLDGLSPDDTLVVWRLDRLARSVKELTEIANDLARRKVSLRVTFRRRLHVMSKVRSTWISSMALDVMRTPSRISR